jgi:hypothetical protein
MTGFPRLAGAASRLPARETALFAGHSPRTG